LPKIPLIKSIEATKLHPKTGTSLGVPDVTISYGALIEYAGSDRDRERFTYLGDLYACKREAFLSATGGVKGQPKAEAKPAAVPEPPASGAPASAAGKAPRKRLEWERVNSSDHSVSRAMVPGGWLVALNGAGVTFVPDPGHRWDGGTPE
jgi:hypothetical protein